MKKSTMILLLALLVVAVIFGMQAARNNTLEQEKNDALTELSNVQAELNTTSEQLAETTAARDQVTADLQMLKAEHELLSKGKEGLATQLTQANNVVTALTEERVTLAGQIEKANKQVADLTLQLTAADQAIAMLTANQEGIEATLEAANIKNGHDLDTRIRQLIADKNAAEEALAKAEEELTALRAELATMEEKLQLALSGGGDITVLHTNDVHARVVSGGKNQIGYTKLGTIVEQAREAGGTLLLDAGDTLHGMAIAGATQGQSVVDLMNMLGYDAMTPGNHDFNYGYERLKELEKSMDFALVNANILLEDGSHAFTPYVVLEVSGRKVAVVGAANPQMQSAIHPDQIKGLTFAGLEKITEAVESARQEADAVIILAHWGSSDAYDPNSSVLAQIPGVNLVVDGHSHTAFADIKQVEGAALVVSAGQHLEYVGRVQLAFDAEGGVTATANPIAFEDTVDIPINQAIENAIIDLENTMSEVLGEVVGKTEVLLDGERENVRTRETNLGNLAADALLKATAADFAFTNGGGIRRSIATGDITRKDVVEVFPFGNSVLVLEVTGAQLLAAMEHGLRQYPEQSGGFPQIAGGTLVFSAANEPGNRVMEFTIAGKPVDSAATYQVATNDFLAAGGDGFDMLKDCPVLGYLGTLDEILGKHITALGTITLAEEQRIVEAFPVEETPEATEAVEASEATESEAQDTPATSPETETEAEPEAETETESTPAPTQAA